jgi:hypothetical protein
MMEPKVSVKKNYILVEPQEREFWAVLQSFGRLFQLPEYQNKNTVWLFHEGPLQITFDELYKIKDFLIEYAPDNTKQFKKVAIVVETDFQAAMATEYAKIMEDLPRDMRVFSSLQEAEAWIAA